jgi:dihydroflavonol-4-reductase
MTERRKVLVTGASGFVGARLVRQLIDAGEHVRAMVRATSDRRALSGIPAERLEVVEGDVMIEHTIFRSLAGCDRLYHVAAVNRMWDRDERRILDAAIVGTESTLAAAKKRHIERVVYTSSVATLGATSSPVELDETHPFNLQDPATYTQAKKEAEEIALRYNGAGLPVVVVSPTAIGGPGDWKPTLLGASILRFLRWSSPFMDFPVPGGGINVVDVDDVARGHKLAMEQGTPGERYILGGDNLTFEQLFVILSEITGLDGPGRKVSKGMAELVGRLSELRARITGAEPEITFRAARDYSDSFVHVTSAKAERELGYTHRSARRTLLRSVQWYLEHGYLGQDEARRIRVDLRATA